MNRLARLRREVQTWHDLRLLIAITAWATAMPVLVRLLKLETLLKLLTPVNRSQIPQQEDVQRAIRYTNLVLGCHPLVPNTCMMRSLVLYRILRELGLSVTIHFGVRKADQGLGGHCWLTQTQWAGFSFEDGVGQFVVMYAFPPASTRAGRSEVVCL